MSKYANIIPASDTWAVVIDGDGGEPMLRQVSAWAFDVRGDGQALVSWPAGGLSSEDEISKDGDDLFIGSYEQALERFHDETERYEACALWMDYGTETIDRLAAWASEQTDPWVGVHAWESIDTPLRVENYGLRVIDALISSGRIERIDGSDPAMFRTIKDPNA